MFVVSVSIHVKEDRVEEFLECVLENARHTVGEPGNVRFDVLQQNDDRTRFQLYEAYRTADDFAAHQRTPHYLAWREAVADWMAEPRVGIKLQAVFPPDADW